MNWPHLPLDSGVYSRGYAFSERSNRNGSAFDWTGGTPSRVSRDTIRISERQGVLQAPPRRASSYRQYSEEIVRRLRFIQRAKRLGFSLKEITDLLTLRVDERTACAQVQAAACAKLEQVEQKLVELERMRQALLQVAALCTGEGPASTCPLLDALDQQEPCVQLVEKENGCCPSPLEHH